MQLCVCVCWADVTGAIFWPSIDYVDGRDETLLAAAYNGTYLTQLSAL